MAQKRRNERNPYKITPVFDGLSSYWMETSEHQEGQEYYVTSEISLA